MFSKKFQGIYNTKGERYSDELPIGSAYAVVHEITKLKELSNNEKYRYIRDFCSEKLTVQEIADMIKESIQSDFNDYA